MKRLLLGCALAFLLHLQASAFAGCAAAAAGSYRLQVSDVVDVQYPYTPEFDESATLAPDGSASLKQAGHLHLAGLTVPQAQQLIRKNVIRLRDPLIIVSVKDGDRPHIFVGGEVRNPGKLELRGNETLLEAIAQAGGFNPSAKEKQVILVRKVSGDVGETTVFNMKKMQNHPNGDRDPQVCSGDYVFVPQNRISKVERYVKLGNVGLYMSPTNF